MFDVPCCPLTLRRAFERSERYNQTLLAIRRARLGIQVEIVERLHMGSIMVDSRERCQQAITDRYGYPPLAIRRA